MMNRVIIKLISLIFVAALILFFGLMVFQPGKSNLIISPQNLIDEAVKENVAETQLLTKEFEPISLEKIFDQTVENVSDSEQIVLLVTGDVIPARSVNYQATVRNDFLWPYRNIAETVKSADITFINLETPLIPNCPITQVGMVFCGSDKHIEGLLLMGVDVASIANNHAGNAGVKGLGETIQLLEKNKIEVTGDVTAVFKKVKGVTFGFLGFNDISGGITGIEAAQFERIKSSIEETRKNADAVVVMFHWGAEYRAQPDSRQIELAHYTIDSGADLVASNHPHWVQPVELYNGKVIMYAHGNTIFDQEWSEKTKQGVLGKYIFAGKELVDIEYIPIGLRNYGEAFIAEDLLKDSILKNLKLESENRAQNENNSRHN